jgi:hypothetical protein
MIKRLERLKNTVNKYMADIRPDRLKTCQSEQKSVVSRRPSVFVLVYCILTGHDETVVAWLSAHSQHTGKMSAV